MTSDFALVYSEGQVDPQDLTWWDGPLIPVIMSGSFRPVYVLPLKGPTADRWQDLLALIDALRNTPPETQERIVALLGG